MKRILLLTLLLLIMAFSLSFSAKEISTEVVPRQKRSSERGIYVTAHVAQLPVRFNALKEGAKRAGLNTLVIDAKEALARPFIALARDRQLMAEGKAQADPWLTKLTAELHEEGFIVTARIVVNKDDRLALIRPDLGVQVRGGGLYRDHKGGKWLDPYAEEAQLYNVLIAESAALSGVDEIQFDYIRFPAEGEALNAYYPHQKEGVSKVDAICNFLRQVRERTEKYQTSLAVDIFGVVAWQSQTDIDMLGQDLKRMGQYLDVISPMLYPSHFHAGYDGYANPGSEPYYFMNNGVAKSLAILSGEAVRLVPWLQGFNMLSPNYGPQYILDQVRACQDAGVEHYLIWNARNDYAIPFRALSR